MTKHQTFIDQSVSIRMVSTSWLLPPEAFAAFVPRLTSHSQILSL